MHRFIYPVAACVLFVTSSVFAAEGDLTLANDLQAISDPMAPFGELVGTAVNSSSRKIALATITFNLYDSSGNLIGNAVAQAQQLDPGQRWTYKALAPVAFDHAKVSSISAL